MFGRVDSLKIAFGMILVTFLLLFVATYYTFRVALKDGPVQLVDKDYYQIGLNYEKTLAEKKNLKTQGYHFQILNSKFSLGKNDLQIAYKKGEEFLSNEKLVLVVEKKATDKYNRILHLENSGNIYTSQLDIPQSGKWLLTVKNLNNNFSETFNIEIP